MEHKHPLLYEDDYKTRTNALMKCAEAALDNNFTIFSVQNGGQCFSGKDAEQSYMEYGVSKSCKGSDSYCFSTNNPNKLRQQNLGSFCTVDCIDCILLFNLIITVNQDRYAMHVVLWSFY